jgi:hypothetical protein
MTRREILQGLLAAGMWNVFGGIGFAAQPSSMKEVENMQKNWKALLADGVKVPLPSEPLKLSKEEWRKRLGAAQFNILREEGDRTPRLQPAKQREAPRCIRLRRL